ncbi:MAG: hypothetical protein IJ240_01560 [Clostridia bacterium]|nr:hypothetical protein [Clostridia bacterium]
MSETYQQPNAKTHTFSCPSCGGRMVFDPESQKLKCPYCDSFKEFKVYRETPNEYDIDHAPPQDDMAWGDETRVARCNGCGAEIVLTGETSAKLCPFCGAPHVEEDQSRAGIAPESLIAFRVTPKKAAEFFQGWLKRKLFVPTKAKKNAALDKITGVYLPHWTYDADSVSQYVGRAGHYYYVQVPVTVTGPDGKKHQEMREERRVRWEPASGVVSNVFDDIVIVGSKRLSEGLLSSVQPFDLDQLTRYSPEFISGFACEKPVVDVKAGWNEAQGVIDREMRSLARRDILRHADEAEVTGIQTENSNVRYKLMLLPMYLSAFPFKDKTYHVIVNGQNGKVGGQTPISAIRVAIAVVVVLAILLGLYYVFTGGGNGDYTSYMFELGKRALRLMKG